MSVTEVTDATFNDVVLKAAKPVVVDYWADWCGPCKQLSPVLDELSEKYDEVLFTKMDTNANPNVPMAQGVQMLPTIQFWVNGELVNTMQGGQTKMALRKAIENLI